MRRFIVGVLTLAASFAPTIGSSIVDAQPAGACEWQGTFSWSTYSHHDYQYNVDLYQGDQLYQTSFWSGCTDINHEAVSSCSYFVAYFHNGFYYQQASGGLIYRCPSDWSEFQPHYGYNFNDGVYYFMLSSWPFIDYNYTGT